MRSHARLLNERYRIDAALGEGAMGTVVRGEDELLRRPVAIKLLRPAFAADEETVARFYAEARAAARIVDPHVVAVHDVVADGITHAIVMELVDGPSLATILSRERKLPEATALRYARDVAHALAAAHARGLLHRDVKPANALRTPDDGIKVTDFGLAKAIEADVALTEPGRLVGSAAYFSPEQAQGLALTPASDLYSLGVVLHQMLTGRLPFDGSSPVAVAVAHVTEPAPSLTTLAREMRPEVARIVQRLLRKEPGARFASASELLEALDALRATPAERRGTWEAATMLGGPVVPPPRPKPRPAIGAAAPRIAAARRRVVEVARRPAAQLAAAIAVLAILLVVGAVGAARARALPLADFRRQPVTRATALLHRLGYPTAVATRADRGVPAGRIVDELPAPGTPVRPGETIRLVASSGPPIVTMPDLTGAALGAATQAMRQLGIRASFAARVSDAPANTVVAEYPSPGTQLRAGTAALVVVSAGPHPRIRYVAPRRGGGDGDD